MILTTPPPTTRLTKLSVSAPAKLNLVLKVLGRRSDGFHDVESLVVAIDHCDEVSVRASPGGQRVLCCNDAQLPQDRDNFVWRAAEALAGRTADSGSLGWDIELTKRIAVGAGMGGGSSDAATTLFALNELWQTGLSLDELAELGATIGSDVPLFFAQPSCVIRGRGERVERTRLNWSGWVTLICPGIFVATKDVYAAWRPDDRGADTGSATARVAAARSARDLGPAMANELESAIARVAPRVEEMHRAVSALGSAPVRVSGAGSTLFALFDTFDEATALARAVTTELGGLQTYVVRTLTDSLMRAPTANGVRSGNC